MCGIAGRFQFQSTAEPVNEALLSRMGETLAHRGPDGGGVWVEPKKRLGLAHRRLAIVDLSPCADQPFLDAEREIAVVFNGEIYNHAEIREELRRLGHAAWKTDHSDTEVIVRAYRQWGCEAVHRFRGMFAFALWDTRRRELWLVRDRIGVKPLYWTVHHGVFCFASEIKALLVDPELPRSMNEEAFYHFLSFLTTPAPNTLFDGIFKLPGGCWLCVREDGTVQEKRWWDVWDYTQPLRKISEEEAAERVLSELRTAVRYRKVSDVPVGIFLSGGIDSSTNAVLFAEGETKPVRTFSIGYAEEYESYPSELKYARRVAQMIGAEHHEKILTEEELIAFAPQMAYLQDEPIADPVCFPVYFVSKLAREHGVPVCQVGEGSDELFWGYPSWKRALELERMNRWPVPRALKHLGLLALAALGKEESAPFEWLRRGAFGERIFWGGAEAFYEREKKRLLSPRLRERFKAYSSWEALKPILERFQRKAWEPSILHWMTYLDLNLRLPELLLMRVDKMSMGVALEARVPFLDHRFVELVLSFPQRLKTRGGRLKHLLKLSVKDLLPRDILERKKQGFGVPVQEWLWGALGKQMRETLNAFCRKEDLFDAAHIEKLFQERQGPRIWFLYNFVLWKEKFITGA